MKKKYYIMILVILIVVIIGIILFFINRKNSDNSDVENILLTNEIQNISNIIDENNIIQNILSEQTESDNLDEIKNMQSSGSTENQLAIKLENMINSDNLYVINMTGIAYERDYISGEIVEYPFEDMDPYQIIQPYKTENKIILEITSNKNARLSDNEILETIITYE